MLNGLEWIGQIKMDWSNQTTFIALPEISFGMLSIGTKLYFYF